MTAPDPGTCGERGPSAARCTRPEGHAGGHLDEQRDIYWQAAEPAEASQP